MSISTTQNHIGNKISRIRELRGLKQEFLAQELGVSQQTVSNIEKSATIEEDLLAQVSKILGVTPEAIKNYDEEKVLSIISNTFNSNDTSSLNVMNVQYNFNPIEKLIEVYDENKKLYERLLESEKDKVEILIENNKMLQELLKSLKGS